jgi:hypothetical protein
MANLRYVVRRIRTCSLVLAGAVAAFAFAVPSYGDSLTYNFTGTAGAAGSAATTLTSDGVSITAQGYGATNTIEQLFIRNDEDRGFGLIGTPENHEITGNAFIQVNLSQLWAQHPTSALLGITDADEGYNVWGSNTAGVKGTLLLSNATAAEVSLLGFGGYQFISVSSSSGSVLLNSIKASDAPSDPISSRDSTPVSTPEPGILTLLALGLTCAGFIAYRWGSNDLTQA